MHLTLLIVENYYSYQLHLKKGLRPIRYMSVSGHSVVHFRYTIFSTAEVVLRILTFYDDNLLKCICTKMYMYRIRHCNKMGLLY